MEKTLVTIKRKWDDAAISITVNDEGISICIPLSNFITALLMEIGSVKFIFSDKSFKEAVNNATVKIIRELKQESLKIMK